MPVQFVCPKCSQLLSVGSRKVGQSVDCPRCRQSVVVPTQEAAALGVALRESSRSPAAPPPMSEFVVYDHVGTPPRHDPRPVDQAPPSSPKAPDPKPPTFDFETADVAAINIDQIAGKQTVRAPAPPPPPVAAVKESPKAAGPMVRTIGSPGSGPMLLVSRPMLYVQGGLFAGVAVFFLFAGYLIGRGVAPSAAGPEQIQSGEAVVLQGTLQFVNKADQPSGDLRGVILALPGNKLPNPKLPIAGLRTSDADLAPGSPALLAIESLGGAYQRAAADGSFNLAVPQPGSYLVCFVSANALRPDNAPPDEFQLALVKRYFEDAEGLIGRQKFAVKMEELPAGAVVRTYDFGKSGL